MSTKKLTDQEILSIQLRVEAGVNQYDLATMFDVHQSEISRIANNKRGIKGDTKPTTDYNIKLAGLIKRRKALITKLEDLNKEIVQVSKQPK